MIRDDGLIAGKYELLEQIATGGMAEVHRAVLHASAGVTKMVVIKRMLPELAADPAIMSMFVQEAKIATRMSHGNVAQVYDFGESGGSHYLVMEFIDGLSLSQLLKRLAERGHLALPATLSAGIVGDMCRGLAYAHTLRDDDGKPLGVVHRDVSTQNLMLGFDGQVKVVDFGIAKARLAGRVETQVGHVRGKIANLAPEQLRAEPLDARTDVYGAGVVLYRLLTGRAPYQGSEPEILGNIVVGEHPRAHTVDRSLPRDLTQLVDRAMAFRREDRFESAAAFAQALGEFNARHLPRYSPEVVASMLGYAVGSGSSAAPRAEPRLFLEAVQADAQRRLETTPELVPSRAAPAPRVADLGPVFTEELPARHVTTERDLAPVAGEEEPPKALGRTRNLRGAGAVTAKAEVTGAASPMLTASALVLAATAVVVAAVAWYRLSGSHLPSHVPAAAPVAEVLPVREERGVELEPEPAGGAAVDAAQPPHAVSESDPAPSIIAAGAPANVPASTPDAPAPPARGDRRPRLGALTVLAAPPADIFIKGQLFGRTPLKLRLRPGVYWLTAVEPEGRLTDVAEVTVKPGIASTVELTPR